MAGERKSLCVLRVVGGNYITWQESVCVRCPGAIAGIMLLLCCEMINSLFLG